MQYTLTKQMPLGDVSIHVCLLKSRCHEVDVSEACLLTRPQKAHLLG